MPFNIKSETSKLQCEKPNRAQFGNKIQDWKSSPTSADYKKTKNNTVSLNRPASLRMRGGKQSRTTLCVKWYLLVTSCSANQQPRLSPLALPFEPSWVCPGCWGYGPVLLLMLPLGWRIQAMLSSHQVQSVCVRAASSVHYGGLPRCCLWKCMLRGRWMTLMEALFCVS